MSRPGSRFMRSMTPSGSVKMSTSKFNMVCGKTREMSCTPNLARVPNPQPPKVVDARVTTPTLSRREFMPQRRETSVGRDYAAVGRPPAPPHRESSLYLPFGSYADLGCHTKPPNRYSNTGSTTSSGYSTSRSRRSVTPSAAGAYRPQTLGYSSGLTSSSSSGGANYNNNRRYSATFSHQSFQSTSRQRHSSCSFGTPASARGIPFY